MFVKSGNGGFDSEKYDVDGLDFECDFIVYYGEISRLVSNLAAVFNVNREDIVFSASGHTLRVEFDGFDCSWENVVYANITPEDLLA